MQLIFGVAADGRVYPDFPGPGMGALDESVVGPAGLVNILETQLGLTGPRPVEAVRIAAYAGRLRAVVASNAQRFFAASLEKDPWATARLLLGWRDQLVAAGWSGNKIASRRLEDLAAAEAQEPVLPDGLSDRLRSLLVVLEGRPPLLLESLTLIEHRSILPLPWQRLVEMLGNCGVVVRTLPRSAGAEPGSDLRRVQDFLADGSVMPLQGDGSFTLVQADTTLMAAETLAEWLAAGTGANLDGTVILSSDGDSALLDKSLTARGLPALGQSSASPWRGALQVLPLAFAIAWKPFNPKALLDLLLLPRPPISRSAARKLAHALTEEPGTGAGRWERAWTEIEHDLNAKFDENAKGKAAAAERLSRWREWTSGGLYGRSGGMPATDARAVAARVAQWAIGIDAGAGDPLLLDVAGAAGSLSQAIDVLGQDPLPALLVERMINQVLAEGAQNPDHLAEAGGLRCVKSPSALWAPAPRLVWWDFKGPGDRVPSSPWSRAEIAALEAAGCRLEPAAAAAARITSSYANAVHMAGERLILIRSALSDGEETISHPLAHQLDPLTRACGGEIRWRAEQLLGHEENRFSGRTIIRRRATASALPSSIARWSLPDDAVQRFKDRWESATSFERMVDCQLRWLLLDVLHLPRGQFAEIPGPNQLLGNLAHELANRVLRPGPVANPDDVEREVTKVFEDLLTAIAAPLQQPEYAGELATARSRIPPALAELAELLRQRELEVVATEAARAAEFADGLKVRGRIDLLVHHAGQGLGVIDLKWTKSVKRRREEIADGHALQLATYGVIANSGKGPPVPGAYYLLNQRRLLGERGSPVAAEEIDATRSLPVTWSDLVATWRIWRDLAVQGTVIATGVPDAATHIPTDLPIPPSDDPCSYCELTTLCRIGTEEV